jgi:hypothetical protein
MKGYPDDFVTLVNQTCRGDRRIQPAAHGDDDTGLGGIVHGWYGNLGDWVGFIGVGRGFDKGMSPDGWTGYGFENLSPAVVTN